MPRISYLNIRKMFTAQDNHRKTNAGNERLEDVFQCVAAHVREGIRNVTYKDMSEMTGHTENQVKYYFKKLVYHGAIGLDKD